MVNASALWSPARDRAQISDLSLSSHWRFWGTLLWSALIFIVFCITQILVPVTGIIFSYREYSWSNFLAELQSAAHNGNTLAYATFASTIVCCSLIGGIIKMKKGATLKDYLYLYRVPIQTSALWSGVALGFIVPSTLILYWLGEPITPPWFLDVYTTAKPVWVLWIALLIGAPIFEETFFRGFMFKGFQSSFLGITGTIVITSTLWALIHVQYDLNVIIVIWCFGILLATARQMTGSLLIPLCLHALINLGGTVEVAILH